MMYLILIILSTLVLSAAEGIPVLVSPETNYSLAGKLYQLGIH